MYYYLEGMVAGVTENMLIIDCGGVGYACGVSLNTLGRAQTGKKMKIFTHLHVREDSMELFGFATLEERNFFRMLTDISGVGPRAALSILSCSTPDRLALGIVNEDEKLLTAAQGVGKKLAQRIILELKDKVAKGIGRDGGEPIGTTGGVLAAGDSKNNAVTALMVLGYSNSEARTAVAAVEGEGLSTEEIIRLALKKM